MESPQAEYQRRLELRQESARTLDLQHARVAHLRTLAFAAMVGCIFGAVGGVLPAWAWAVCLLALLGLVIWHQRIANRWREAEKASQFYARGLDRIAHRWAGKGLQGKTYAEPDHPYQRDLDLFGPGSLFELLCLARTRVGQDCLARWLLGPAPTDVIEQRQQAIQELRDGLDLREQLAILPAGSGSVSTPFVARWGAEPARLCTRGLGWVAGILGILGTLALGHALITWRPLPLLVVVVLQQLYLGQAARDLGAVLAEVAVLRGDLAQLIPFLEKLQGQSFASPLLSQLLKVYQGRASQQLRRLEGWIDFLEWRRNPFLMPLVVVSLATVQGARKVEDWRRQYGRQIEEWLASLAEFEGLSCLAAFTYEHPDHVFPLLLKAGAGIKVSQLRHPLLGDYVANDLELGSTALWIISGSNMAGKSSLLRALGVNAVLAMAGAPVRAARFELEPIQVGASIQLNDSLQGGVSRFYAEILRLRQIVDLARESPRLLFLLDEIMAGTNSHDRRIGAEAVVTHLVRRGALGLVTTHDLALTHMAEHLPGEADNLHLQDHLEDGKVTFDYRLQPGPVTKSNALELMRSVGLEV